MVHTSLINISIFLNLDNIFDDIIEYKSFWMSLFVKVSDIIKWLEKFTTDFFISWYDQNRKLISGFVDIKQDKLMSELV